MNRNVFSVTGLAAVAAFGAMSRVSHAAPFEFFGQTHNPAGGIIHPAMLVAFNPQPEPPGSVSTLDMSNPARPVLHTSSAGPSFGILIGLLLPAVQGQFTGLDNASPDQNGFFSLGWVYGDGSVFQVRMHLSTSHPINQSSWVAFNPQPEPPGYEGALAFNFDLLAAARGTHEYNATLSVEVFSNDLAIEWVIPGPAGASLLALSGLIGSTRRRR